MANKASTAKASKTAELNLELPQPTQPAALPRMAYTLHETAEILGISYISVYRLTQRKKLKCSTALPGRKLIPLREIENFLSRTAA
jgi:hypothetical protein